jgi:hypothetical protein
MACCSAACSGCLPYDVPQYLAASSSWLIHDHFTGDAHHAVLMYVLYVALGKMAGLFHWSMPAVFQAALTLTRALTLAVIYLFVATVRPHAGTHARPGLGGDDRGADVLPGGRPVPLRDGSDGRTGPDGGHRLRALLDLPAP